MAGKCFLIIVPAVLVLKVDTPHVRDRRHSGADHVTAPPERVSIDKPLAVPFPFDDGVGARGDVPVCLKLLESVHNELSQLSEGRRGLLLGFLESRCEMIPDLDGSSHPDEMLVALSDSRGWPVLTVDRGLKERLVSSGGSYIEVTSGRFLRLVEA